MTFDKYIGIPFVDREIDCYGLIRLIYKNELDIIIPEFMSSCKDTKRIFSDYLKQISEHWIKVEEYEPFDVIAMAYDPNHPKIVQHFAIYIGNGKMIHTFENIGSFVCKVDEYKRYIKGVYRWKNK